MKERILREPASTLESRSRSRSYRVWLLAAGCLLVIVVGRFQRPSRREQAEANTAQDISRSGSSSQVPVSTGPRIKIASWPGRSYDNVSGATAEQIVAQKLTQYARNRREVMHALARRHGVIVPPEVEAFFDAVESGNWDEIEARFKKIDGGDASASTGTTRPPGVQALWPAIIDTYGVADEAHHWPAQQLLDYGNAVLRSLSPGTVYVGGTDPGRWIPTLLNETSEGERHIIVTQNGLADSGYLDYVDLLYSDRFKTLTKDDSERAFNDYIADARKRLEHDLQFPEEPKQIRPGENVSMERSGKTSVSGQIAVMGINERLLQMIMEKNPELSFALEESFPLKSTYAQATPAGPIMELRTVGGENALTSERAAQAIDYWRGTAEQLLSDTQAPDGSHPRKAWSKMAAAQANLFAERNLAAEAEQAYRLATEICPSMPDATIGLSDLLRRTGRADEARRLLDDFARNYPKDWAALQSVLGSGSFVPGTSR